MKTLYGYKPLVHFLCAGLIWTTAHAAPEAEPNYGRLVRTMLDTLIDKGRDRYGEKDSPLIAAILNAKTLKCPENPPEHYTTIPRIGERVKRRSPGGANLYFDQATFKAMDIMSKLTGEPKYRQEALKALRYQLNCAKDMRGLPALGGHTYWHFYKDTIDWNCHQSHEVWNWPMAWDIWWQADPDKTREYVDLIWKWHVVDKETGEANRHSDGKRGLAFTFMLGNYISCWAHAAEKTGETKYIEYCERVAEFHWSRRNANTNLTPGTGTPGERGDQKHFTTMVPVFAYHLIVNGKRIGSSKLVKIGRGFLDSYAKYGYDQAKDLFYCSLALDGTPVKPEAKRDPVTGQENLPVGYLAVWQPYVGYHELPLPTAQVYAWAAESVDRDAYLTTAERWGRIIEKAWRQRYAGYENWFSYKEALSSDPNVLENYKNEGYVYAAPFGLFADHYGRVIQIALTMHRLTGEKKWQNFAKTVADAACAELWNGQVFIGHVGKELYENSDHVGILLYALLQLEESLGSSRDKITIPLFF